MNERPPRLSVFARRILSALRDIGDALQEQNKATAETNEAANAKQSVTPLVRAEVDLPHGIETHKSTNDARADSKYKLSSLVVSWLTFIAVVVYAGLAYLQWREMIRASDAAADAVHEARLSRQQSQQSFLATVNQFRLDQRAWVGTAEPPIIVFQKDQPLTIRIPIKNTGKTPALDLTIVFALRALLPNQIADFKDLLKPMGHGVLQPGGIVYMSSDIATPLNETSFNALSTGTVVEWVYGEIRYSDVFGCRHWTTFAQTMNPKVIGLDTTQTHNEVDKNECPNQAKKP